MRKIASFVLSFMLVLGSFVVLFNVQNKFNFFEMFETSFVVVENIADKYTFVLDGLTTYPIFDEDDKVLVYRYWYERDDNLYYVDTVQRSTWLPQKAFISYSTDPLMFRLSINSALYLATFYDERGNILYDQPVWYIPKSLRIEYGDYFRIYRENPSMEGWHIIS